MKDRHLTFGYDKEADVLYISLGRPRKGMRYVEIDSDRILRIDPNNGEVVGLTIMEFSRHFSLEEPFTELPLLAHFTPEKEIQDKISAGELSNVLIDRG